MASPGSAAFKTPTCFANDITNVPARVAAPKRTRSVMRQTALSFGPRSSSPPAAPDSSSSSPVIHSPLFTDNSDHAAASADAARLSSPLATSPSAAGGFLDARDDKMELDDEVAPANEHDDGELTTTTKRRRLMDAFEGPRLVCAFDLSKGKRKMETLYNMPGKQMSVFDAVRKRELGFKAGSAQGQSARRWSRESGFVLIGSTVLRSLYAPDTEQLRVQQRGASFQVPVDSDLPQLCATVRPAIQPR